MDRGAWWVTVHGVAKSQTELSNQANICHTSKESTLPFSLPVAVKLCSVLYTECFISVQFIRSVLSDYLRPHEPQHSRLPCPWPTPGVHPNPCPLSQWCHPTILCHPLLLLLSIFPNIRVFSNESVLHIRWPKYWSFSFNISPSNKHSGLISFRMDWLDLLAVQGTIKSLPQHHNSKESILQDSAFFIVQLSHPYMTTANTIALTRQKFVGKVMSVF